jgi:RNA polymerase sigma-70 factor (ECF subfamily)
VNAHNFFAELKQRNVYKVAIAYGVVAWLLMQVASQIFPFFDIPNWAVRLVIVSLVIGFPVALVLAWAFDLTPQGIKRAGNIGFSKSIMSKSRNSIFLRGGARAASFPTTHWSVLMEAQGPTLTVQAAMDKLCRTYWRPVYGYLRQQGVGPEQAKDFTHGFFALLLEHRDLDALRKEKGRLRSYLLGSVKHFLTNVRYRAMAIERGKGRQLIPLDALWDRDHVNIPQMDKLTADQIYECHWALTVLNHVLARLETEYRVTGPAAARLFERLQKSLTNQAGRHSAASTADGFKLTENAMKEPFHQLRRRYRQFLREEIAQTVAAPGDIEDELRHLIAVLRAYPAVKFTPISKDAAMV